MRVVIGEDQTLLREGLAVLLANDGFDVVAAAPDAITFEQAALEQRPDLVVADIRMPPTHTDDGLRAALRIRAQLPATAILVLSQHVQQRYATQLLADGARGVGYLLKQRIADVESFCLDARRVAGGGSALDPDIVSVMLARHNQRRPTGRLTDRQQQVIALMAEGRSNAAIAQRLSLTEKAVVNHISRIYEQLGLPPSPEDHRRVLAVVHHLTAD
jgi:DNA-binding NarL/FixJ family response regulator